MEKELAYLGKALSGAEKPFVSILGGAKVSDKIEVVQNLMKIADSMLIGKRQQKQRKNYIQGSKA